MTVKELFKKADPTIVFYAYIMLEPVYDEYKEYDVQTKAEGLEELRNKLLDNIQLIVNAKDNINEVEPGTIFVMERKSTEYDRPFESYTEAFLVKDEEVCDKVDKDFTIWNDNGDCITKHYAFDFVPLQTIANYNVAKESVRHMGIETCCAAILNEVCFWGLTESTRTEYLGRENNDMNYCIDFDNAISTADEETLSRFLEKVVPDMQEELEIAFYGISFKSRNLLLDAMPKRRAELILDNMDFFEKGVYRTKGKESINKACKMMLDILNGKEVAEELNVMDFAVTGGDDPMLQFEHFILDAPEREIIRVIGLVVDSELSVASYYLSEKAKERLFEIIGEELTGLIKEDHSFMDNPSKKDVREACERIINKFDV